MRNSENTGHIVLKTVREIILILQYYNNSKMLEEKKPYMCISVLQEI